jgi:HSP20 family protein
MMQKFGNTPGADEHTLEPLVDVVEEDDEIIVVAEVPGVERDEIKVRIKGTSLTIHANNPERPYHKVIELPSKVKKNEAKSAIRNGVLEVRLKKA